MSKIICFALLITLIACQSGAPSKPATSSGSGTAKTQEPAITPLSGREGFYKMYAAAHLWAPDAKPYSLQSNIFKDHIGHDGKAVIWRAGFASPSRRTLKAFVWSGVRAEDAPAVGVSSGTEDTYSPTNSSTQVFDPAFLKVDSDKAFAVAQEHGGEKLLKQNANLPVSYLLDWSPRQNILTWHVIYGADPSEPKLKVAVNASTGDFERVEK